MKTKSIIVSFTVFITTWFIYNNTLDLIVLGTGVVLSAMAALLFCRNCDVFCEFNFSLSAIFYTIIYWFVFLGELVKSNFDVARRVLTPSLPINPGIVEVKTKLKSKMARLILANSISLTPGTLTVDIKDDTMFIHWIDVQHEDIEGATQAIVSKFENYLIKIYG